MLVPARHERQHGPQEPRHGALRVEHAEEEAAAPWGGRHCIEGHDARLAALLQVACTILEMHHAEIAQSGKEERKLDAAQNKSPLMTRGAHITHLVL